MKKTTTISIAGTIFTIEDDAFAELDRYLASVKKHFENDPNKDEIIADIEARIAERFAELGRPLIILSDVQKIMNEMGSASQFDGDESAANGANGTNTAGTAARTQGRRRLYRDTGNALIGGVAAGFGAYLGIDPLIIRLIFLASVLFGGSGIVIYIILWVLIPEAETPSQILEMRGDTVTLSSMSEIIKERAADLKKPDGTFRKIISIPINFLNACARFIRRIGKRIVPIGRIVIGVLAAAIAFGTTVGASIIAGTLAFNVSAYGSLTDLPLATIASGSLYYFLVAAAYASVVFPAAFILICAWALLSRKNLISNRLGLVMLSLWFISLVILGVSGARFAGRVQTTITRDPSYQTAARSLSAADFTAVEAAGSVRISLIQGDTYAVVAEGRTADLDLLSVALADNGQTLLIDRTEDRKRAHCPFCSYHDVTVTITAPQLSALRLESGASAYGTLEAPALNIDLAHGSSADISLKTQTLSLSEKEGSWSNLSGIAGTLSAQLENSSSLNGDDFSVSTSTLNLSNGSRADLFVGSSLTVTAANGSTLTYRGSPEIRKTLLNGSQLERDRSGMTEEEMLEFADQ